MSGAAGLSERPGGAFAPSVPDAALTHALRAFVRGRIDDHADADDLVQETFLRLFSCQASAQVASIKALCFSIARHLMIDRHRQRRRYQHVELADELVCPEPTAEMVVAYRRAVAILVQALERMPPLRREIFFRRRLDGITTAGVAASLAMSSAAVEKHVTRAMHDLRGALEKRGFTMEGGA